MWVSAEREKKVRKKMKIKKRKRNERRKERRRKKDEVAEREARCQLLVVPRVQTWTNLIMPQLS